MTCRTRASVIGAAVVVCAAALLQSSGAGLAGGLASSVTTAGDPVAGSKVFASAGCAACHTLSAAKATGKVGPNLDTTRLDAAAAAVLITNGRNVMPSFKVKLTAKQIADVAAFVTSRSGSAGKPPPTKPAAKSGGGVLLSIRLTEGGLALSRASVPPGRVRLVARNAGTKPHALLVVRVTPSLRVVASLGAIAPGKSLSRTFLLEVGRYVFSSTRKRRTGGRMVALLRVRAATSTPGQAAQAPPGAAGAVGETKGARLFVSLGCAGCHTFAPAKATGTVGPNLGLTRPSAERITSILNVGSGAMPSFAGRASQQDMRDLAAFITSENDAGGAAGSAGGGTTTGSSPGAKVFADAGCGACHTFAAAGATGTVGPSLDALRPSAGQVAAKVASGGPVMPSFSGRLTAQQIQDVAAFVSSSGGAGASGGSGGPSVTGPPGLLLFQRGGCGGCHTLAAAKSTGAIGPSLDRKRPDADKVVKMLREGKSSLMPSFASTFTAAEMQTLGAWIESVTRGGRD